mmetsp:Transcript_8441/g.12509  ORF Transcript_8441/g.12509 Transcript_8441/m.12509 type:complete len:1311 (+) Transcript_8441:345-4277(+)|eukprot:CAMPEP_0196815412 /NCGR_PEP_ID=MMETSP1362-20130617/49571_1 /TAXON_ID=163516 /ORGANISM="Leptocylindrus danicus, Strain CCMP1856" /LENGTH=1310 /DNA_ID=CAMNT_0042192351 /DNA_START=274 /DNA_END=4206 /DNA_ORIENTATION=+
MSGDEDVAALVFMKDEHHGYLPARIVYMSEDGPEAMVQVELPGNWYDNTTMGNGASGRNKSFVDEDDECVVDLTQYPNQELPVQNLEDDGTTITCYANMSRMKHLSEPAVLFNLKERLRLEMPYTRAATDVLISMNPMDFSGRIESLYEDEVREEYCKKLVGMAPNGCYGGGHVANDGTSELEPHVFETSALAFHDLAHTGRDQSIIITGVSGSGKSEAAKFCLCTVVLMCATNFALEAEQSPDGEAPPDADLPMFLVESNPIFEAFGNSATVLNTNSSRFGKLTELLFARTGTEESPRLVGANFSTYLLDTARVVGHGVKNERGYHIFYQLLASPKSYRRQLWEGTDRLDPSCFRYLGATNITEIENGSDKDHWYTTIAALETFSITEDELRTIMIALCIVLQLGNITIGNEKTSEDSMRSINTSAYDDLEMLSKLMGVTYEDLNNAITRRTVQIGKNHTKLIQLMKGDVLDNRDSFAKMIYSLVFDWLVERINDYICPYEEGKFNTIRFLDYFGFEQNDRNQFETLAINYACEKMQCNMTDRLFRLENQYRAEGIIDGKQNFNIPSNLDILDLFERGHGLITVLTDESSRNSGSDSGFVFKIKNIHRNSPALVEEIGRVKRSALMASTKFTIRHSVGTVEYDGTNFIASNKNKLSEDLLNIGRSCTNKIISEGFAERAANVRAGLTQENEFLSAFSTELDGLISRLNDTKIRHIVCIRPNDVHAPKVVDQHSVLKQLRSANIFEGLLIERSAGSYCDSLSFSDILDQYICFYGGTLTNRSPKEIVRDLLGSFFDEENELAQFYKIGNERVFFSKDAIFRLEEQRQNLLGFSALTIQCFLRGVPCRSEYLKKRRAIILIQSCWRRHNAVLYFNAYRDSAAAYEIEESSRCRSLMMEHESAVLIQGRWRIFWAKACFNEGKHAARVIQKSFRAWCKRKSLTMSLHKVIYHAKMDVRIKNLLEQLPASAANGSSDLASESKETIVYMHEEMNKLRGSNLALQEQLSSEKGSIMRLKRNSSLRSERSEAHQIDVRRLNAKTQMLEAELRISRKEAKQLQEKLQVSDLLASKRADELNLTYVKQISERDTDIACLRQQLSALQTKHNFEKSRLSGELEKGASTGKAEIAKLNERIESILASHKDEVSQLLSSLEQLEHDRDDIKGKHESYESELKDMKEELDSSRNDYLEEVAQLQREFRKSTAADKIRIRELEDELHSTKSDLEQCKDDLRNNASDDVHFLRSALNKAHNEIRKNKLEMDALKASHEIEKNKIRNEMKKRTAPCRRCTWQKSMTKAKARQKEKNRAIDSDSE